MSTAAIASAAAGSAAFNAHNNITLVNGSWFLTVLPNFIKLILPGLIILGVVGTFYLISILYKQGLKAINNGTTDYAKI